MRFLRRLLVVLILAAPAPAYATPLFSFSVTSGTDIIASGLISGQSTNVLDAPYQWYMSTIEFTSLPSEMTSALRGVGTTTFTAGPTQGGPQYNTWTLSGDLLTGSYRRVLDCELNCAILSLSATDNLGLLSLYAARDIFSTPGLDEEATLSGQLILQPLDESGTGGPPLPVPEPGSGLLLGAGVVALGYARVRHRRRTRTS